VLNKRTKVNLYALKGLAILGNVQSALALAGVAASSASNGSVEPTK
jgi:hypothetical protein